MLDLWVFVDLGRRGLVRAPTTDRRVIQGDLIIMFKLCLGVG